MSYVRFCERTPENVGLIDVLGNQIMGKHYVPQRYLEGFSVPGDERLIWMFDKLTLRWVPAAIKQVAQQRDYFPPEVELQLATLIEKPANRVIDALSNHQKLIDPERTILANYIAVMIMRVPRKRRKGYELVPSVLESIVEEIRDKLSAQGKNDNLANASLLLNELDRLKIKFNQDVPENVRRQILSPWPSTNVVNAIKNMTWRFVRAPSNAQFLTTDNPAFFFEGFGLAKPEAELTFPLSSDRALIASHQGEPGSTLFLQAKPALVKEINRRVASGAERFVFFHRKAAWVETLATKKQPYLSRIAW